MASVRLISNDRRKIEDAVTRYVAALRRAHPEVERVLWFGSRTRGCPAPGSDVDLCLVLSHSARRFRDRVPEYLPGAFPVGLDLHPYTREKLDRLERSSPEWYAAIMAGREV